MAEPGSVGGRLEGLGPRRHGVEHVDGTVHAGDGHCLQAIVLPLDDPPGRSQQVHVDFAQDNAARQLHHHTAVRLLGEGHHLLQPPRQQPPVVGVTGRAEQAAHRPFVAGAGPIRQQGPVRPTLQRGGDVVLGSHLVDIGLALGLNDLVEGERVGPGGNGVGLQPLRCGHRGRRAGRA